MLIRVLTVVVLAATARAGERYFEPGPLAVEDTGEFVLHDHARDEDLPVRVRSPAATDEHPGPFPLVVFSHGAGGSSDAFPLLSEHLAAHGYVVVHPTHADSIRLRRERGEGTSNVRRELLTVLRHLDITERAADASFILDSVELLEREMGVENLIDRERFAMAGHSAGAMTTQVLGGARFYRTKIGNRYESHPDGRFMAFVLISGQGTNSRGLRRTSWEDVDSPWLVLTGSEDRVRITRETPRTRREPFEFAPPDGKKYLVYIDGATHSSYQGRNNPNVLGDEPPANIDWIAEITNASTLAFLDAYVKGDDGAKAWLDGAGPSGHDGGELEFGHK